jgi:signal peptidase
MRKSMSRSKNMKEQSSDRGHKKRAVYFTLRVFLAIVSVLFIRFRPLIILSGSMEPFLPVGSIIILDLKEREPETGSIVTYRISGTLITHRLIRTEENRYITKGDSNPEEDPIPVGPEKIVGTVRFCIPWFGFLFLVVRKQGILFLALILLIHIFYQFVNQIWRKEAVS